MSDAEAPVDNYGLVDSPTPPSISHCALVRERDKHRVNEFLEMRHPLGGVPGWKACFSARYRDSIVALVVIGRPVSTHSDDGTELSITRYCRRDDRPANTGSWLIARARQWAYLEGYETLSAHAGVAGNFGTTYEAAGFVLDCPHCDWTGHSNGLSDGETEGDTCPDCGRRPVAHADGDTWTHRPNRKSWDDYERRKWVYQLRDSRATSGGDGR